jgi:hypothetical protein
MGRGIWTPQTGEKLTRASPTGYALHSYGD